MTLLPGKVDTQLNREARPCLNHPAISKYLLDSTLEADKALPGTMYITVSYV